MTLGPMEHVVVVGSSLAGLRAGETLRTEGFTGRITLVGAERHQPYDRPPLSKQVLAGTWEPDRIALRRGDGVAALGMDLQLGVPAVALDTEARSVTLADGRELPFDGLVVATGSSPRRVPGQLDLPNVHELRTLDDALALRARLADGGPRVVVVGAGFIGLEVAATATGHGCRVTVLEAAPAPLIRGLGAALGAAVVDAVSGRVGFDVRCGSAIAALEPDGVRLAGGSLVTADVVVVGIGVSPATAWL
ncbi:MAG: FAD-dependent oxidoreductase, partial [Acidimicrobiia bacterium]|nr:FAD-dependent oxidoreductase [Acidimicrobiia bacterium]